MLSIDRENVLGSMNFASKEMSLAQGTRKVASIIREFLIEKV